MQKVQGESITTLSFCGFILLRFNFILSSENITTSLLPARRRNSECAAISLINWEPDNYIE